MDIVRPGMRAIFSFRGGLDRPVARPGEYFNRIEPLRACPMLTQKSTSSCPRGGSNGEDRIMLMSILRLGFRTPSSRPVSSREFHPSSILLGPGAA